MRVRVSVRGNGGLKSEQQDIQLWGFAAPEQRCIQTHVERGAARLRRGSSYAHRHLHMESRVTGRVSK